MDPIEVDLLAHCEFPAIQPGKNTTGFVNLLMFDTDSLEFECSGLLELGDVIAMKFVLPRMASPDGVSKRAKIQLECTVRSCLNIERFHYAGEITRIEAIHVEAMKNLMIARTAKLEI